MSARDLMKQRLPTTEKPYCDKCNNTGLLPFIKNGKVIPNVKLFCECHEDELEYYQPLSAKDLIDFPVSWGWWRHFCQYYDDGYDPGPNEPPEHTVDKLAERLSKLEEKIDASNR